MKRTLIITTTALVILATASLIYADIARPKTVPTPAQEGRIVFHTGLTVVPQSEGAYEARLQISQQTLKDLQQAMAGVQPGSPSMGQRIAQSSTRTIIAGLFLSLSFGCLDRALCLSSQLTRQLA
jgi:hypothetical protein